jgi:hypothetical protein
MARLKSLVSLRLASTLLIALGLLTLVVHASWLSIALVILGCAVRPLVRLRLVRHPLSHERLRRLSEEALDVFSALEEHLRLIGRDEVAQAALVQELEALGHPQPRQALAALLASGLIELRERTPPGPELKFSGYALVPGASDLVAQERERRLRTPRLGKRSRPSPFAERLPQRLASEA